MNTLFKYLFAGFLLVAALVHVYGLIFHTTDESDISHFIHLVSYTFCLVAVLKQGYLNLASFIVSSLYPIYYHLCCAITFYQTQGGWQPICILVVLLMPLIGVWLYLSIKHTEANIRALVSSK